jgi:lysozyme
MENNRFCVKGNTSMALINVYRKNRIAFVLALSSIPFFLFLLLFLFYFGILRFNYPSRAHFPVHGLDVSHHQGKIEWNMIDTNSYSFVFIKASEGGDFVDPRFHTNFPDAVKNGFVTGAYHFFTFRTKGSAQAENFLREISSYDSLIPVVDLEYMGNSKIHLAPAELEGELEDFLDAVESEKGCVPVLYTTFEFYNKYLIGKFEKYPIWIRDIFTKPELPDKRFWYFWQFSNRGRVAGVNSYVDLNVFNGTESEWKSFISDYGF